MRGDSNDPAYIDIWYYNRDNATASPDKWKWLPAWVDPLDNVDILDYSKRYARLQPYHSTIKRSDVLLTDIRLTKAHAISAADLQRISQSSTTTWTYRKRHVAQAVKPPQVGSHVAQRFGHHGICVGRITAQSGAGADRTFTAKYQDHPDQMLDVNGAIAGVAQYNKTGAKHTATGPQPSKSMLMRKRLAKALKRRPPRTTHKQRANVARAARARRRAANAVVSSKPDFQAIFKLDFKKIFGASSPRQGTMSQQNAVRNVEHSQEYSSHAGFPPSQ